MKVEDYEGKGGKITIPADVEGAEPFSYADYRLRNPGGNYRPELVLDQIYTQPAYRGSGMGSAVMRRFVNIIEEVVFCNCF